MIKNIIFDFDGVILDSVPIKTEAFKKLFEVFPSDKVEELLKYHKENGGISRYVKIRYFFEEILKQSISKSEIDQYAMKYSQLTLLELSNPQYLIKDTLNFIKYYYKSKSFHIASGADENDLKFICEKLNLSQYFVSIHGSPVAKSTIVKQLLKNYKYELNETCLVGDSINDFEAASKNQILFFGYNNQNLQLKNCNYLNSMTDLLAIIL